MEKWVQIFKCIISHSSVKSLVPPLHKFTIRNLDLFFPIFGKNAVYLLTCQYLERMGKKIVPSESRITFCRLFIIRVKKVNLRGTSRMFFALYSGVSSPIYSYYNLYATEQGRVSVLQWNKHPTLLIQKRNKK